MLEFIDDIYVFAASRRGFGDIIASRVSRRPLKKDLFSQLTLCEGENEFLANAWSENKSRSFAVMGIRDGVEVPLIVIKGLCGAESLGLVIEMHSCDPVWLRKNISHTVGISSLSKRIYDLAYSQYDTLPTEVDYSKYLNSTRAAESLVEYANLGKTFIYDGIKAVADLVGVKILIQNGRENRMLGVAGMRYAGSQIFAMLLMMALAAREHAPDRTLTVKVMHYDEGIELESYFNADNTRLEKLERYVSDISEYVGVLHNVKNSDGIFKYEITPYIRDVALIGLKCPDDLVREIFYSGVGMEALEQRENTNNQYNQYMQKSNGELKWQNTDREE